jgi:hypothetical protein
LVRHPQQVVGESRVLVCALDSRFRESLDADSAVYLRHYRRTEAALFSGIGDLLRAIELGYDIIHLFSPLAPGGLLSDASAATLLGSDLIEKCCERDVKLLWIANDNKPDDYVKGFRAVGSPLNLIMTISRNKTYFGDFLENLLFRMSGGETLPIAWTALAPQAQGLWQECLPSCIFFAGRADVRLLSRGAKG